MIPSPQRLRILQRDNFTCQKCGRSIRDGVSLQVGHIVPRSLGGDTSDDNLRAECSRCNQSNGNGLARISPLLPRNPQNVQILPPRAVQEIRERALVFFNIRAASESFERSRCAYPWKSGKWADLSAWRNAVIRLVASEHVPTFGDAADGILLAVEAFTLSPWARMNGRWPGWTPPCFATWLKQGHMLNNPEDWYVNESALSTREQGRASAARVAESHVGSVAGLWDL